MAGGDRGDLRSRLEKVGSRSRAMAVRGRGYLKRRAEKVGSRSRAMAGGDRGDLKRRSEKVGSRSQGMAGSDRGDLRRRSQRLIKLKDARASEEEQILNLKRELKDLMELRLHYMRLRVQLAEASLAARLNLPPPPCDALPVEVPQPGHPFTPLSAQHASFAPLSAQPAGKSRKVIKTMVPEGLIEYYILNPRIAFEGFNEEKMGKFTLEFRKMYALQKAIADKTMEYRQVLIKQFRNKGFAEDYEEVFTDDVEGKDEVNGKGMDVEN